MSNKSSPTGEIETGFRGDPMNIRVGELLAEAGIVSSAEMTEAIQVSKRLGVPIGRVLTMSGWVPEPVLQAALQVQQLIRSHEIPLGTGIHSLQRVFEFKMSLAEALEEEDLQPELVLDPMKLAELLVDSNIVSAEQMETAMQAAVDQGVPLGSTLVMQGFLSEAVLPSLEAIQRQIYEGMMSREDGLKAMQSTFMVWVKAEESLRQPLKIEEPAPRPEKPAHREDHLGDTRRESAPAEAPKSPISSSSPAQVQSTPAVEDVSRIRLVDLLKQAEVFSQPDVQKRYDLMLKDPVRSAKFFLELGLVDEEDIKNALRAHSLMTRGHLTREEAVMTLRQFRSPDFERVLETETPDKVRRYTDKKWRGNMGKILGGALVGALVAGVTMGKRKP